MEEGFITASTIIDDAVETIKENKEVEENSHPEVYLG